MISLLGEVRRFYLFLLQDVTAGLVLLSLLLCVLAPSHRVSIDNRLIIIVLPS